jgi:hypothetical protein
LSEGIFGRGEWQFPGEKCSIRGDSSSGEVVI